VNIDAAISFVEGHIDYGTWAARSGRTGKVDLSLDRMRRFIELLDNPQVGLPIIHVTGTNGKGSTSRMITRLLMAEGLRVGTYSSPHLARYNERFRINDIDIDDNSLAALLTAAADAEDRLGERLMPFEVLTGAAYTWFAQQHVDVAVIEVGVLGRFDATNVGDGSVAVVTNIGFDHTDGEGDWQQRIAAEKAGIVKPGAHLILGRIDGRLEHLFEAQGAAHIWRLGRDINAVADTPAATGRHVAVTTPLQTLDDINLSLHGSHQSSNCALAVAAASAFLQRPLNPSAARSALSDVRMPARLETVLLRPQVLLDGAHNPDAARALGAAIRDSMPCDGKRTLIIGLLAGRDPSAMLTAIGASTFDTVITCTPPTARARPASELATAAAELGCTVHVIDNIGDALQFAIDTADSLDQIVVTGSIYLVADAREWLLARSRT
jgi:dihydrofolate synthase/folylpolyglutamate synthase